MRNETQILKVKKEIQEKLWLMNNIHRKIYDEAINKEVFQSKLKNSRMLK